MYKKEVIPQVKKIAMGIADYVGGNAEVVALEQIPGMTNYCESTGVMYSEIYDTILWAVVGFGDHASIYKLPLNSENIDNYEVSNTLCITSNTCQECAEEFKDIIEAIEYAKLISAYGFKTIVTM